MAGSVCKLCGGANGGHSNACRLNTSLGEKIDRVEQLLKELKDAFPTQWYPPVMVRAPYKIVMLFVEPEKIQPCLVDVQRSDLSGAISYANSTFYLKDDNVFAVEVRVMRESHWEREWKEKWDKGRA